MTTLLKLKLVVLLLVTLSLLAACSGGTEGTGENGTDKSGVHGLVEAPGGAIAFADPDPWSKFLDSLLGKTANAAIDGLAPVGAGVKVNLIQVDASGSQVGNVIASAETKADGTYNIAVNDFQASSQYVVRATANNQVMDARVTNLTVNVNPISDAASQLIANKIDDLNQLNLLEVEEIFNSVNNLAKNVDPTGLNAQSLSTAMQTEALSENDSSNIISSTASHGLICGTVLSPSGQPLANVRIIARDYGNWVTRAASRTISDGSYCLNVPISGDLDPDTNTFFNGQYILGAVNRNSDSQDPEISASEWWTQAGDGYSQFAAEKIVVENSTMIEKNFNLASGGRISGKITSAGFGASIEGITVVIRNFTSLAPVASARSDVNGNYSANLIPGSYYVEARNTTLQPLASEVYDGQSGSNSMNHGIPVVVVSGQNQSVNFSLNAGHMLSGTISQGVGGTPITGHRIMINLASGGGSVRIRSNKVGNYNVWLLPDVYNIYTYGQSQSVNLNTNVIANFNSALISTIHAKVLHNDIPVSQAKVRLYTSGGNYVNQEPSSSDGNVDIYTNSVGEHLIETRIDEPASYASSIYDNLTQLFLGTRINVLNASSTIDIGNINLPDSGILSGKVTSNGSSPLANITVQVRDGLTGNERFITVRSRGDGSYLASLPAGNYARISFNNAGANVIDGCNSVNIIAGQTTTLNYNLATASCSRP